MERSNEPTAYNFEGGRRLRGSAISLGARTSYSTKKIEFFHFPNGRRFLLEPDREDQVNLGFQPGLGGPIVASFNPVVGKNSNVKSHWGLPNNEFQKIIVAEASLPGSITVEDAIDLLNRVSR